MLKITGLRHPQSQVALLDYAFNVIIEAETLEDLGRVIKDGNGKALLRKAGLKAEEAILVWIPEVGEPYMFLDKQKLPHGGENGAPTELYLIRNMQRQLLAICDTGCMEHVVRKHQKKRELWTKDPDIARHIYA